MLFNFPSRYLSAIGLATVFSLRWSLPPALGCIPKQPDSEKTRSGRGKRPYGPDTRRGTKPRSEGHRRSPAAALGLPYVTTRRAQKARRFDAGLFPVHSPLLGESLLVSFPPLSNMLKFSGCSRLNSGRIVSTTTTTVAGWPALSPRRRRRRPVRGRPRPAGTRVVAQPDRPVRVPANGDPTAAPRSSATATNFRRRPTARAPPANLLAQGGGTDTRRTGERPRLS